MPEKTPLEIWLQNSDTLWIAMCNKTNNRFKALDEYLKTRKYFLSLNHARE